LLLRVIENCRPVLVTTVAELTATVERIDIAPVNVEQFLIGDLAWIVLELQDLRVPRAAGRYLLVGRIGRGAAHVAGRRLDHTLDLVKVGLRASETAAGERRDFQLPVRLRLRSFRLRNRDCRKDNRADGSGEQAK